MSGHELREVMEHLEELRAAAGSLPKSGKRTFKVTRMPPGCTDKKVNGHAKRVHLIRHGQGHHNVWGAKWFEEGKEGNAYSDPGCPIDATLTEMGEAQARALIPKMNAIFSSGNSLGPIVVVSTLRRATQTALLALSEVEDPLVMATDRCREEMGLHRCDKRLTRTELESQFPDVDYLMVSSDEDAAFDPKARESKESLVRRASEFAFWLMTLHEDNIIVASHSSFLLALVAVVFEQMTPGMSPEEGAKLWFSTGELRTYDMKVLTPDEAFFALKD